MESKQNKLSHVWQLIVALDAKYSNQTFISPTAKTNRLMYLRRRNQLARMYCGQNNKITDLHSKKIAHLRHEYLQIRSTLMSFKYGLQSSPTQSVQRCNESNSFYSHMPVSISMFNDLTTSNEQPLKKINSLNGSLCSFSMAPNSPLNMESPFQKLSDSRSISNRYAFSGIDTILDHHKAPITRLRFAHNESTHLAVASADCSVSICHFADDPADSSITWLRPDYEGAGAVMDVAWSFGNDLIITATLDGSVCIWDVCSTTLQRRFCKEQLKSGGLLACEIHPLNNNYLVVAGTEGVVQAVNLSTGKPVKEGCDRLHTIPSQDHAGGLLRQWEDLVSHLGRGCITALAFESSMGECLWVGTDQGLIQSYLCSHITGSLTRARRLQVSSRLLSLSDPEAGTVSRLLSFTPKMVPTPTKRPQPRGLSSVFQRSSEQGLGSITCLSARSWLTREDSSVYLLANSSGIGLLLFKVISSDGRLAFKRRFHLTHQPVLLLAPRGVGIRLLRSCFAPLISFRSGACAVSASEDANVYLFEVLTGGSLRGRGGNSDCVTFFQGHTEAVLDVALSWDESVLASADESGSVILWRRRPQFEE